MVLNSAGNYFFVPQVPLWKWGGGDLDHDIKNISSFVPKKSISDYTLFANIGPEK